MRSIFVLTAVSAFLLLGGTAGAVNNLASAPLAPGDGGFVCSCTNLTKDTVLLDFVIRGNNSTHLCHDVEVDPGEVGSCVFDLSSIRACHVKRDDGASLKAKQFACNMMAVDTNDHPIVVVPVNMKLKQ